MFLAGRHLKAVPVTITLGENQSMVFVSAQGPGTVTAPGFTNGRKAVDNGSSVTLTAVPNDGMTFLGWKNNGENTYFDDDLELTITINGQRDIIAVFVEPNPGELDG